MKTHWKQLQNPDYLGAYSLPEGKDMNAKILSVSKEIVTGEKGKADECTVAKLEGQKPMILNATNSKMISKIYGTPYIEEWAGKEITLFVSKTKYAGEDVECLRIRPEVKKKPILKKGTPQFDKVVSGIKQGYTIDQVKLKYEIDQKTEIALLEI